ncbi:hypothetical protein [Nocardia asteroides]|uniref:hypothetical protein n=1 Tax=Nocardia asteroides TaxID=1824 RepID=UPI001E4A1E18|nr:hypothetical protein [Nocardia asteroides]UGT59887.1 hypothetical protein LTT61_22030 [Nocardia asteroides]
MSKKKNTRTVPPAPPAPAPERGSRSGGVAGPRRDSTPALWAALRAHPGSTTAALADTAGVGLSTARRLLAQWETAGHAQSHTDPESPRAPKTWSPGTGAPATVEAEPPAEPAPAELATPEPGLPEPVGPAPVAPGPVAPADDAAVPGADVPADPGTTGQTPVVAPTGDVPAAPDPATPAPADTPAAAQQESTVRRLPAGGLRGLVEDFLHDNPREEFTPHQIGKALDRSSGAVHNALVKLAKDGTAQQTGEAPKKFRFAS